jgi:hypothetical protein
MTLQSFYVAKSDARIAPYALLYLAAQEDPLTGPAESHKAVFAKAGRDAEFKILTPHHLATYFDDAFERSIGVQLISSAGNCFPPEGSCDANRKKFLRQVDRVVLPRPSCCDDLRAA